MFKYNGICDRLFFYTQSRSPLHILQMWKVPCRAFVWFDFFPYHFRALHSPYIALRNNVSIFILSCSLLCVCMTFFACLSVVWFVLAIAFYMVFPSTWTDSFSNGLLALEFIIAMLRMMVFHFVWFSCLLFFTCTRTHTHTHKQACTRFATLYQYRISFRILLLLQLVFWYKSCRAPNWDTKVEKSELNGNKDKGQIECVMNINKKIGMKICVYFFFLFYSPT